MNRLILGFLSFLFFAVSVQAQDASKLEKEASKAFNKYNLDQTNNKGELKPAKEAIDACLNTAEGKTMAKAWNTKGDIYSAIANEIVTTRQLGFGDASQLPQVNNAAYEAAEAYKKGLELAEKKFETKDALKGLAQVEGNLSNLGIFQYEDQEYEKAFQSFSAVLDVHEILKAEGEKSALDNPDDYMNQKYIAGLAALNANKPEAAANYFKDLYEKKYDKPAVYEAMYKIEAENDINGAYQYLEAGRERYPDDVSLLFADINHHLRTNQLDALIGRLNTAIQKEPDNVSLYTTTGNVYDNLYQKAYKEGNEEKAQEYFDKAKEYYSKGLEKDPKYFDAIYSLGTLYYNKAATLTQGLNKLADDYSKEGIKKYEDLKAKIFEQFDEALPYFQRCEKLNPNDINTLIALKEIYARKDQLDISDEFKRRLETVQSGGKNDSSYFNK